MKSDLVNKQHLSKTLNKAGVVEKKKKKVNDPAIKSYPNAYLARDRWSPHKEPEVLQFVVLKLHSALLARVQAKG